jgi:hypothetical protein
VAKQKPNSEHWLNGCPQLTVLNKGEFKQMFPNVCLGCFRRKRGGGDVVHKSPLYMKDANAEGTFCASCKTNKKLCISRNLHQAVPVPESFAGAGLMDFTLVASSVVANSRPWPPQVLNKGGLGQQTLLTSQITIKNGDDSVRVKVFWDSGSESCFFHPALFPFATHKRKLTSS